jgi:triacylglycerol lipase
MRTGWYDGESMSKLLPADTWNNLFYPPPEYKYFENSVKFDFEPAETDFSWKNAWWLADAALLAYVKDWDAVVEVLLGARFDENITQIGAGEDNSTKGFFALRSEPIPFAVLAFRGTDIDDGRNAHSDEDTFPEPRDGYIVHRGFRQALDQVWEDEVVPALTEFIGHHPEAPIYFTGHSLGAALATIAVARFTGPKCALYTIGSPRVGDDLFAKAVLKNTGLVFRFVNCQDIVTQIPPEIPLVHYFHHVGMEKYFDRRGNLHDYPSELQKAADVVQGVITHDGKEILEEIRDPLDFLERYRKAPFVNAPPFIIGNHTPARYSIRIWNYYSGE